VLKVTSAESAATRHANRTTAARPNYREAVAPFLENLRTVKLPPRAPKGSIKNIRRILIVAAANHQFSVRALKGKYLREHRQFCHLCKVRVPREIPRA